MAKSQIAVRIPPSVLDKLNHYVETTGITKTEVIVGALVQYLGCGDEMNLSQRVTALEAQVKELQAKIRN